MILNNSIVTLTLPAFTLLTEESAPEKSCSSTDTVNGVNRKPDPAGFQAGGQYNALS
jgi:hypothetical protein